ncbi:MAG: ATP-binding protein [Bacteroidetes bacterium]|nr:ATP-binding protein [Bacteroidota bacterium]
MKRFFNVTGLCNPTDHFMVDPLRGLNKTILDLIDNKYYFTIHAPRQTGKTTLLRALMDQINADGARICLYFSVETAGYRSITIDDANKNINRAIIESAKSFLPEGYWLKHFERAGEMSFKDFVMQWTRDLPKALVLLIDEIDALYDDTLISVLRQLRDGFQLRPGAFPSSVALVGLRDVWEYKEKVRNNDKSIGSGSPFNIKAESLTISNFSRLQIAGLLQQYTDEGGQSFDDEVVDLIYLLTGGQPWLVNALAREITDKILEGDTSKPVTVEIVEQAKENLIMRRDTHLDSLIDKLMDARIRPIIDAVISGADVEYDNFNDNLQYAVDLGLIKKSGSGIMISNEIYKEIIPRVLNLSFMANIIPKVSPQWFIKPDGRLDMDALLREFQDFYREHSESWLDKFSFHESGKQLLLMAFLQRIVNGGGSIAREMAVGRGRTDLVIEFNGDRFLLELKIKRSNTNMERTYKQLFHYLDQLNLPHGYLVLFELKNSDILSWEERIKWTEFTYESQGAKKQFSIVEM